MSEPIQSISQGNYILQGTVATSAGIVGDGSQRNPLRADETELYYNPINHNVDTDAEFVMSESIWNFEKVMITFDNMEFTNRYVTMIIDLSGLQHNDNQLSTPWCNGDIPNVVNIPWALFKINAIGNIKYVNRGLIYGRLTNPEYTTGVSRGLRVVRCVGINRIANN